MRFDDILVTVGSFGRYQVVVYLLVCLVTIPSAFNAISIVFLAGSADHWCAVLEWRGENCSSWDIEPSECADAKRYASIPLVESNKTDGEDEFQQCAMYNVTGTPFVPLQVAFGNSTSTDIPPPDYQSLDVIPCSSGWDHDTSQYSATINMDFELVCDRKDLSDMSSSLWFVGVLVGSVLFGYIADRIGRCKTLWCCVAWVLVFGVATAFAPTFWWFAVLRMILAIGNIGLFIEGFVLGTEYVGPSQRVLAGNGIMIAFSVGYMGLSMFAYFFRDWRALQLAITIPTATFFLLVPIIPESARWLLSKGRVSDATSIISKIAKVNKAKLPDPVFTEQDIHEMTKERGTKEPTILDLFKTPNLRMESLYLLFNWMVESLVYYGLALSSSEFGVNVYIAAFVSGAVEIPAYVSSIFALEYFGRRASTCFYMVLGGVACICTIFTPLGIATTVLAMIGKFGITASFSIIYIYTAELYPTPVRSVGVGMCSMSSRIGGIIAPFIRISGRRWAPLPSIIYGVSSIAAGLLALLMPETKGLPLPETMEEGENLRYFAANRKNNRKGENEKGDKFESVPMTTDSELSGKHPVV